MREAESYQPADKFVTICIHTYFPVYVCMLHVMQRYTRAMRCVILLIRNICSALFLSAFSCTKVCFLVYAFFTLQLKLIPNPHEPWHQVIQAMHQLNVSPRKRKNTRLCLDVKVVYKPLRQGLTLIYVRQSVMAFVDCGKPYFQFA
jgi:hypothetical protein